MSVLKILIYPDPRLRKIAQPVTKFDLELRNNVRNMAHTMYKAPGIGLASIQVGIPTSIVVIDLSEAQNELNVLVNPEILEREGEQLVEEGCLSFPGYFATVKRSQWIRYRAQDVNGKVYEKEAEDLFAVCVQHEIDHLTGKLFLDYMSRLRKHKVRKQFEKAAKIRQKQRLAIS